MERVYKSTPEQRARSLAYYYANKEKVQARMKATRSPDYNRHYNLKFKFGIDQTEYEKLLAEQGGVCGICGQSQSGSTRAKFLAVDHDHTTGKIRGLLCAQLNKGIGCLKDSPEVLRQALKYLEG